MRWYDDHVLPHLIHAACGTEGVRELRDAVVPLAQGRVLELGLGSGLNLSHYDPALVELVWGLEPSAPMRVKARPAVEACEFEVRVLDAPGESIPLDDDEADSIVVTFTLCSIDDWHAALAEMRRVLKPGGLVAFAEHGRAPDASIVRWQQRLGPTWNAFAGGCHLDRPIVEGLHDAGFETRWVESAYRGRPRAASFMSWGVCAAR